MPLAPAQGVAWFEVDRAEVPGAKRRTLVQQGAQLVPGTPGATHPLRVASWELVEADLLQVGAGGLGCGGRGGLM